IDQRNRAVLHFRRRVSLGVDVADLLQLERPLERRWETVTATEVEEVLRALELLGDLLDLGRPIENVLNLRRQLLHLLDDLLAIDHGESAQPRELEREEKERDYLAGERLCRRNADLGSGVDIDAAITLTRDGRTDDVYDSIGAGAARLRFAHRGQRVGGLARL